MALLRELAKILSLRLEAIRGLRSLSERVEIRPTIMEHFDDRLEKSLKKIEQLHELRSDLGKSQEFVFLALTDHIGS